MQGMDTGEVRVRESIEAAFIALLIFFIPFQQTFVYSEMSKNQSIKYVSIDAS
jgi:hypothetical protein